MDLIEQLTDLLLERLVTVTHRGHSQLNDRTGLCTAIGPGAAYGTVDVIVAGKLFSFCPSQVDRKGVVGTFGLISGTITFTVLDSS